jgi:hypothetical protein
VLDYGLYLRLLHDSGYRGPVILHGLSEAQVDGSVAFLQAKLADVVPVSSGVHAPSIESGLRRH